MSGSPTSGRAYAEDGAPPKTIGNPLRRVRLLARKRRGQPREKTKAFSLMLRSPPGVVIPVLAFAATIPAASAEELLLRYERPAGPWTEALPVGNGRLGAMVFGGAAREQLQLNESSLWSGAPKDGNNPEAKETLPKIREALFAGDYALANRLARRMQGPFSQAYQPLGDLFLEFPGAENPAAYSRTLDLDRAVVATRYEIDGATYTREVFASHPDQVIVVRLTCDRPRRLSFTASVGGALRHSASTDGDRELVLTARAPAHSVPSYWGSDNPIVYDESPNPEGMKAELRVRVLAEGGEVSSENDAISVRGADSATLILSAGTSYAGFDRSPGREGRDPSEVSRPPLAAAASRPFAELLERHLADHRALFRRVGLALGPAPGVAELSTEARLLRFARGEADPGLAVLLFNYGRYLLIACSRPGGLPANLQGIWNDSMRPPWSSNYTLNINTEMNYWPAEVANLAECHEPLFGFIERLAVNGARTAEINYGARGWVAHHNSDLWAKSTSVGDFGHGDPMWANWNMSAAWLCQHLWEHYAFGRDEGFLRERAWPLMKGAAEFCLDWLVDDGEGRLVTAPSTSPEIDFHVPEGGKSAMAVGATMDLAIVRDLFANVLAAARVLGIDDDFTRRVADAEKRILPYQIGARGQLQEWARDLVETDVHHRHTSHLFGVYPGRSITPETPALLAAARRSLELRGDESTGWALGWRINLWARFRDGDRAHVFVRNMLRPVGATIDGAKVNGGGVYPNLFDAHPPFQIDGNFAFVSGVAEMLVQSHLDAIELLPALPSAWPSGSVRGLRARGGFEVDLEWNESKPVAVTVRSTGGSGGRLRFAGRDLELGLRPGESRRVDLEWLAGSGAPM